MELKNYGISKNEANALTDRLRTELFDTGHFKVVEREMMEDILVEQGFQQTGCTTDECLVEIGQLIGVEQMIGGSISKVGPVHSVSVRIISVETGEILATGTYDYEGNIGNLLRYGMRSVATRLVDKSDADHQSQVNLNPTPTRPEPQDRRSGMVAPKKNAAINTPNSIISKPRLPQQEFAPRKVQLISPLRNTFLSLVLPGLGQLNLQKRRGILYTPAMLLLLYFHSSTAEETFKMEFHFMNGSSEARTFSTESEAKEWSAQFQLDYEGSSPITGSSFGRGNTIYNDDYLTAMGIIYIINIIDAAVTTYRYNNEKVGRSDFDLAASIMPENGQGRVLVSLSYNF